jgi:hypothetical protein
MRESLTRAGIAIGIRSGLAILQVTLGCSLTARRARFKATAALARPTVRYGARLDVVAEQVDVLANRCRANEMR